MNRLAFGGYCIHRSFDTIAAIWRKPPPKEVPQMQDHSGELHLDEQTKADIRHYFDGVTVLPKDTADSENN